MFALILVAVFLIHVPLLRLPYFWDEAGYYVPAARDLLITGSLIPHSTPSNAHPPLVMIYLTLWWKIVGYAPLVTRAAMLVVSAFGLLGILRLAGRVANTEIALGSVICTALYSVYFTQSSLAQVDLAAAALTFWALYAYVEHRSTATAVWFSLAALAKETAILAPVALFGWELVCPWISKKWNRNEVCAVGPEGFGRLRLLAPILPLGLWYAYHYLRTGYVFGNPEFFRYNVVATLSPLRVLLALGMRLWQAFGYQHLFFLTILALAAMWLPPLVDAGEERPRIRLSVQLSFLAVILAYVVSMAVVGGAELARYMLAAVPLVIIICISTLWRRLRWSRVIVAMAAMAFASGLFVNPPYGFSLEDNLAYRDYIALHQKAETFLETRYPVSRVLTAWPATDELTRPCLGYVGRPLVVLGIDDFSLEQVMSAADVRFNFDVALIFSTKYEPPHPLIGYWPAWDSLKTRFFGYHRDLPPTAAAQILGGKIVYSEERRGQWIAVVEMPHAQAIDARVFQPAIK